MIIDTGTVPIRHIERLFYISMPNVPGIIVSIHSAMPSLKLPPKNESTDMRGVVAH